MDQDGLLHGRLLGLCERFGRRSCEASNGSDACTKGNPGARAAANDPGTNRNPSDARGSQHHRTAIGARRPARPIPSNHHAIRRQTCPRPRRRNEVGHEEPKRSRGWCSEACACAPVDVPGLPSHVPPPRVDGRVDSIMDDVRSFCINRKGLQRIRGGPGRARSIHRHRSVFGAMVAHHPARMRSSSQDLEDPSVT